jgi:hypothetical protein
MPRMTITAKLKNAPPFTFAGNVNTAGDLPRFLSQGADAVRKALKVYPVIKEHAVEKITVAPE